jgi:hypothetical protein
MDDLSAKDKEPITFDSQVYSKNNWLYQCLFNSNRSAKNHHLSLFTSQDSLHHASSRPGLRKQKEGKKDVCRCWLANTGRL